MSTFTRPWWSHALSGIAESALLPFGLQSPINPKTTSRKPLLCFGRSVGNPVGGGGGWGGVGASDAPHT